MKKLCLLAIVITFGLLGFGTATLRAANTNAMLVNIQISGVIQQISSVTNAGVETTTYTTTPVKIANTDILNMLQAEFHTNFPAGAQLGFNLTGTSGFCVLDQNGNQFLHVGSNPSDTGYNFGLSNNVTGAGANQIFVAKVVNNTVTTNTTTVYTASMPDYGIFYKDGQGNDFHVDGLLLFKVNQVNTSSSSAYTSASITLTGCGSGTFFNPADGKYDDAIFTKVKVSAAGKNLVQ